MARKIHHFKDFSIVVDGVDIKVDMSRLEGNFNRAQFTLDSAIMTSMVPFMPMLTGQFINETKAASAAIAGSGQVVAGVAPTGRFLYEGNVMVGEKSRSAWAKKGEKKVSTGKSLTYSNGRTSQWFDKAKSKDCDKWVELVKKEVGAG